MFKFDLQFELLTLKYALNYNDNKPTIFIIPVTIQNIEKITKIDQAFLEIYQKLLFDMSHKDMTPVSIATNRIFIDYFPMFSHSVHIPLVLNYTLERLDC